MKRILIGALAAAALAGAGLTTAGGPAAAHAPRPTADQPAKSKAAALPSCTTYKPYRGLYVFSTAGGSVDCLLGKGNQSKAVRQLQHTMKYCSRYQRDIGVDGIFGPGTESALKWVQRKEGVTADGVYGPNTRKKMYFMVVDGPGNCQRLGV
ncbi:peptidoglycan-binding domain-containing protein [Streptomyces sp. NPDC003032]